MQASQRERSFKEVNEALKNNALSLCQELLPGGRRMGHEYVCGDLAGGRGKSFSVNLSDGVWKDFAAGQGGADLINLVAAKRGMSQVDAKRWAESWLGMSQDAAPVTRTTALDPKSIAPTQSAPPQDAEDPFWWRSETPEHKWEYYSTDGALFATVYRFRNPKTGEKVIRPWCHETSQWNAPEGKRPLLYAPRIMRSAETVVLVEGEKCADAICEAGFLGTTIMGGAQAISKTDWTLLAGRDVILWRDNDQAGLDWQDKVVDALRSAGVASVRAVDIPDMMPPKWDSADADIEVRKNFVRSAMQTRPIVRGNPPLRITDWTTSRFMDEPKPRQFLVNEVIPLGAFGIVAAAGDTGKGMMLLDLALNVAGGPAESFILQPVSFGATVVSFGKAVILSAEDSANEIGLRLKNIDPDHKRRKRAEENFICVPFPDAGGAPPLIRATSLGIETTDTFARLHDQLGAIDNVKLVVIDPLSSFIQADLNKDSAAAAFLASQFANLATSLGATILVAHHMRKTSGARGEGGITSLEQARDAVRGQSALIDGTRFTYAMWQAPEKDARSVLKELGEPLEGDAWRNRVVYGGVVKSNGPADRSMHTFVRNRKTGLLVDLSPRIAQYFSAHYSDMETALISTIANGADAGRPFQHTNKNTGLYAQRERLPDVLRSMSKHKLEHMTQRLIDQGKIVKCVAGGSRIPAWLDVPGGLFARGDGMFETGAAQDVNPEEE